MLPRYPPNTPPSRGGHVYPQVAIATSPRALRVSKPALPVPCTSSPPLIPGALSPPGHLAKSSAPANWRPPPGDYARPLPGPRRAPGGPAPELATRGTLPVEGGCSRIIGAT
ncbi:uncharacterized protein N7511_005047 [Penicillium nucicola]|uniref:uncharacterized protein n=1 Tax=Penicillium nucicola TaxID=1850975 RepID=UPI0025456F54|nr:uncharacterized protein N7511_005047 [Penicillium nucicola]KAJ5764689.1 hypothetical protein N7511_005047 [Penicillium nucicola]